MALCFIYYNLLDHPIGQVLLSIILSVFIILYIVKFRPFTIRSLNYLVIVQEVAYIITVFLLSVYLAPLKKSSIQAIQYIIVFIISAVFVLTLALIIKSSFDSVKSYNSAKSMRTTVSPEYIQTKIDSPNNIIAASNSTGFELKSNSNAEKSDPNEIIHYVSERNSIDRGLEVYNMSQDSYRSLSEAEYESIFRNTTVKRFLESEEVEVINPDESV